MVRRNLSPYLLNVARREATLGKLRNVISATRHNVLGPGRPVAQQLQLQVFIRIVIDRAPDIRHVVVARRIVIRRFARVLAQSALLILLKVRQSLSSLQM